MEKSYTIQFTERELETIQKFIESTAIQGTVRTLPEILSQVATILKKINDVRSGLKSDSEE